MKRPPGGEEIPLGGRPSAAQMCKDSAGNSAVYQEIKLIWESRKGYGSGCDLKII